MSAGSRRVRRRTGVPLSIVQPTGRFDIVAQLQRGWWLIGVVVTAVAALGFQAHQASSQGRQARAHAGLTQKELAARVGVTQQAIALLEHPDRGIELDTIAKVAQALNHSVTLDLGPAGQR